MIKDNNDKQELLMKLPRMMIHMMTMTTALRCFLLDDDALLFVSAACRWGLGGCVLSFMEYYRYKSFVFFPGVCIQRN
jgi:hypothetical protein